VQNVPGSEVGCVSRHDGECNSRATGSNVPPSPYDLRNPSFPFFPKVEVDGGEDVSLVER